MSTQTQGAMGVPLREYRRRKGVPVPDLNAPPSEGRSEEGTSTQAVPLVGQTSQQIHSLPPMMIDVDDLEDDVVESSASAFAEAKSKAQRTRRRHVGVNDGVDSGRTTRLSDNKRRRGSSNRTFIHCDLYINLDASSSSMKSKVPPAPPPSVEPTFNCPICMGPFVEETSTKCGHIFCKTCIKTAIAAQAKCPTCRKRVTSKELIRVFLPATS